VSYWNSFPRTYQEKRSAWLFRVCSKLWFTDKAHEEECRCQGCFLGPKGQLSLRL
jgi:hypothetical protein